MSERTHSAAAETTEFTSASTGPVQPRFSPQQKRKLTYILAGSAGIALVAAVLFQIFRAEQGEAGTGDAAKNVNRPGRVALTSTVARVGGRNITWREVADECMTRHGREILENIINRNIIQQACERQNVVVTNPEVAQEVQRIAAKFRLTPENWYQMLAAERNITPIQYRRDIIWPMLALKKIAGAKIVIKEKDLREPYIRDYGPRVEVRMILFDNLRRAQEVYAELIRNPRDFSRLAQKHSIEPTSRALGGIIPPIRRYSGNKKLEDAAFDLRDGEISAILQVGSRWVILLRERLTKPVVTSIDEVRQELEAQLREEKTQRAVAQIFEKLRRQTRVDNFLTNTRSGIQQTSANSTAGRARVGGSYPKPSGRQPRTTPRIR